jgi:hypothetical protein
MKPLQWVGIVLIVAGILGATYEGFSYTKETQQMNIGPVQLQVKEQERVAIPLWVSLGASAAGLMLLLMGSRKP